MHLIGFYEHGRTWVGALSINGRVSPLAEVDAFWADPFRSVSVATQAVRRLDQLTLVPPVRPSARVLCVGLNYAAHVDEGPFTAPDYPTVFGRWTASLSAGGAPAEVPPDETGLDWEGELLAVVGRPLKAADPQSALRSIFAYAAFNDITARRAQKLTTQWTIGKNVDYSGPMSALVTADEVGDPAAGLRILTTVNGEVVQDGNTQDMVFSVGELLAFMSRTFELRPGDLVATGTPDGVGYARNPPWLLHPGDSVTVDIEKVGSVTTPIH